MNKIYRIELKGDDVFQVAFKVEAVGFHNALDKAIQQIDHLEKVTIEVIRIVSIIEMQS